MGSNCCKQTDAVSRNISQITPNIVNQSVNLSPREATIDRISDYSQVYRPKSWIKGNLIGKGEYGKVYQAMDKDSGELFAVKVVKLKSNSEEALQNLFLEINTLKSLSHNNIIKYYQTDIDPDTRKVKILLEYATGGSMQDLLKKYGRFSESMVRSYTTQLSIALNYLHGKNLVHRDLKSANILITEDAVIKISDFGCSKKIVSGRLPKSVRGSPYWMAPEVVLKQGHGCPADIWSLGCIIIEMLTGRPPWSEYSSKSSEIIKIISIQGMLPKIPKVSQDIREFIKLCLVREPEKRLTARQLLGHSFISSHSVNTTHSGVLKSTNSWITKN